MTGETLLFSLPAMNNAHLKRNK